MKKLVYLFILGCVGTGFFSCFSCEEDFIDRSATNFSKLIIRGQSMVIANGSQLVTLDVSDPILLAERQRQDLETYPRDLVSNEDFVFISSMNGLRAYNLDDNSFESDRLSVRDYCISGGMTLSESLLININNSSCNFRAEEQGVSLYNINDINNLLLMDFIPLPNPQSASIDASWLFVSSATLGLSVYDISISPPELKHQLPDFSGEKFSLSDGKLLLADFDRLHQFEYSIANDTIGFLSTLNFN